MSGSLDLDRLIGARHADNTWIGRMHDNDPDRILITRSASGQGMWDACGRRALSLPDEMPFGGQITAIDLCADERHELITFADGKLRIYTQASGQG